MSASVKPEDLKKRTCSFLQESILNKQNHSKNGLNLQFSPVVRFSFVRLVDYILFLINVGITGNESIAVNRVPVDEKVDDRAVISRQISNQLLKGSDCDAIIQEPKKSKY